MDSTEEWQAMRIIILGDGQIGKTTLIQTLQGFKLQESKSTIGIEHSVLNVENTSISVWDFAGQLEYTVTHQYFLSSKLILILLCFDLSKPSTHQQQHVTYWLKYLNSLLCAGKPVPETHAHSSWKVMLVGTKADIKQPNSITDATTWQSMLPIVPISSSIHHTSSFSNDLSVQNLKDEIQAACIHILNTSATTKVPCSYRDLWSTLQQREEFIITQDQIATFHKRWENKQVVEDALTFLHSIGEIVRFSEGRICLKPALISQTLAKFVAPDEHKASGSLTATSDPALFYVDFDENNTCDLRNELELLTYFGVCFAIPHSGATMKNLFLFPSLGFAKDFQFDKSIKTSISLNAGICITAPFGSVFIPGLFCRFLVSICESCRVFQNEILCIGANGIHIVCPGIADGQFIILLDNEATEITIVARASNPILYPFTDIFRKLVQTHFVQYIGYTSIDLCPSCIDACFYKALCKSSDVKKLYYNAKTCTQHQVATSTSYFIAPQEYCLTHGTRAHDLFINYRVATEGDTSVHKKSVVQLIYDHFAFLKKQDKKAVLVFWDKQCLTYGKNWEKGFLAGLLSAKVAVLLISQKALDRIKQVSATRQDNVLIEYEVAIAVNKFKGTYVLPVFVGEETITGTTSTFAPLDFGAACSGYPNKAHKRGDDTAHIVQELSKKLQPQDQDFLATVAGTMEQVFKLQGLHLTKRGSDPQELDEIATRVLQLLNAPLAAQAPPQHAAKLAPERLAAFQH